VAVFRRGLTAAAVARKLGLAYPTVHYHLTQAGIDPGVRWAEARAKFVALWNAAAHLGAAAKAAGLTELAAAIKATRLRRLGYSLKRMPTRRHAGSKRPKVERLVRKGVPTGTIIRRLKVTRQYVYQVRQRLDADQ
jgi:DNA-binding CsgD family transcriptional regulator